MPQEKTYSQMQTSFTAQFYNYIVPKLKKYEYERLIRILIIIGLSVLVIIIGISILPINQSFTCNKCSRELGLAIASFIAPFYIYSFFKKSFERGIKKKIMPIICNCFPNLEWTTGAYNANFIFKNSYLIDNYDSTSFDDIFKGQFKNVNFDIVKGEFIKKVYQASNTKITKYYHWSDIDIGGFNIYKRLKENIIPEVEPYKMDVQAFLENKENWGRISPQYAHRLEEILHMEKYIEFYDVIKLMIEYQSRLEQESML